MSLNSQSLLSWDWFKGGRDVKLKDLMIYEAENWMMDIETKLISPLNVDQVEHGNGSIGEHKRGEVKWMVSRREAFEAACCPRSSMQLLTQRTRHNNGFTRSEHEWTNCPFHSSLWLHVVEINHKESKQVGVNSSSRSGWFIESNFPP